MVLHTVIETDAQARTMTVHLQSASTRHPLQNYVRAESNGQYAFRVITDEQVEVTYTMHVDMAGELSPDIINSQLPSSTYEDMRRLLTLAES